ncbi:MAG: DUF459 domain-containing protein [Deltaproteobacteria bacterium]|nr:DUF459 domain-containing protein [Deltaproteobacteria bacterium]
MLRYVCPLVTAFLMAAPLLAAPAASAFADRERLPCDIAPAIARPTRILLIGDSNFYGALGHRLVLGFRARGYEVHMRARSASGLARPEFFDWFAEARRLVEQVRPDAIVVMLGANDVQRITWPHLDKRVFFKDVDGWRVAYEARVFAFMQMLAEDGREVFYLSPTNRGWDLAVRAVDRVRDVQRRVAGALPRVHYIDMFPFSSDARGAWLHFGKDELGKRVLYRHGDRIHLTKSGGDLVGQRLLRYFARLGV